MCQEGLRTMSLLPSVSWSPDRNNISRLNLSRAKFNLSKVVSVRRTVQCVLFDPNYHQRFCFALLQWLSQSENFKNQVKGHCLSILHTF